MVYTATVNPEKMLPCEGGPLKPYTITWHKYHNNFLQRTCMVSKEMECMAERKEQFLIMIAREATEVVED